MPTRDLLVIMNSLQGRIICLALIYNKVTYTVIPPPPSHTDSSLGIRLASGVVTQPKLYHLPGILDPSV